MPYNVVAHSFHTRNFVAVADSSSECDDHLRLTGKRVVDFLHITVN